jgi:hypothetical protein
MDLYEKIAKETGLDRSKPAEYAMIKAIAFGYIYGGKVPAKIVGDTNG